MAIIATGPNTRDRAWIPSRGLKYHRLQITTIANGETLSTGLPPNMVKVAYEPGTAAQPANAVVTGANEVTFYVEGATPRSGYLHIWSGGTR